MTRSFAIRNSILVVAGILLAGSFAAAARDDAGDLIRKGRRAADAGRYAEAESTFAGAARIARNGGERGEALYLRAGMTRSAATAAGIYRQLIDDDSAGEWSARAVLELGKIEFALGHYEAARELLDGTRVLPADADEAALFDAMACVMVREYDAAAAALRSVRRGRNATWAEVVRAEAEAGAGHQQEACDRYESLARSRVNPAAWYRYGECLEAAGDAAGARREYAALEASFPQTPEAIRCGGKLAPAEEVPPPAQREETDARIPPGRGYTIQFGSFGDRANAIRLSTRIKETYPGVRIDSELVNYREVFRVRFGYYASREEAEAAARDMATRLDERYTVMPVGPKS
ncbi:MAG TPA: SPOR domain-containing protein [Candidatus Krumholzibacteria bacterium]|nr:SPOR domain-containing protein [Candidatus Krumholzibacteria bacterium]